MDGETNARTTTKLYGKIHQHAEGHFEDRCHSRIDLCDGEGVHMSGTGYECPFCPNNPGTGLSEYIAYSNKGLKLHILEKHPLA